jgi:two-component system, cell cycle sensor histidine kinase and response regulator CckA
MSAKELLRQNDIKFRLLFEVNPLPMCVYDCETLCFMEVNQAAVAHYGYSREEFLSMTITDIRQPEEITAQPAGDTPVSGQWRHRLKDGRVIDVEIASHGISYGGRPSVLSVLQDVTQRNQLEEQLRQSAKMEAIGMLAGGIAHDFNNLLTIINGYSQILLGALPAGDSNYTAAEQIMKAGERAAALTRQLLAFSRGQVLQTKAIDLNQLLAGLETMLRRLIGEDIDLRLAPGRDLGHVRADPGQMEQVVMNLVVNARDAMPRGGVLTIQTQQVELDENYVSTRAVMKPGHYVALVVSDNGTGMEAATLARLFQPFFTTKAQGKGTGLGMTMVFSIVKQSGGDVEVSSEPGKGTSVKVYLPRIDQPKAVEPEAPPAKAGSASETILLVEDEDLVRSVVRQTLRSEGYTVFDAPNAEEARRLSATYKRPIHLLITDVVMPKEGGRALAESLIPRRPAMKVLFMSGYTDQTVVTSGPLDGECHFIQKPFTPAALSRKVREILGGDGKNSHSAGG